MISGCLDKILRDPCCDTSTKNEDGGHFMEDVISLASK